MLEPTIIQGFGLDDSFDAQWDTLCLNSFNGTGGASAKILLELQRQLFPASQLLVLAVRDSRQRLVAGLPLLAKRSAGIYTSLQSVNHHWWLTESFLVDSAPNVHPAVEAIVQSLESLCPNNVWLDWIPLDQPQWLCMAETLRRKGWAVVTKKRFEVGLTRLSSDWKAFEASLSRNTRKRARSQWKRIHDAGEVEFEMFSGGSSQEAARALETALEVEMNSWKGRQRSAIANCAEATALYRTAGEHLNCVGCLRIFFLKLDGQPIAFDFGLYRENCYRSIKVSFDERFASLSPGNVLNQWVLKHFSEVGGSEDKAEVTIDTVGPMNQAIQSWSNDQYSVGRLVIAPGSWLKNAPGRSLVSLLNVKAAWSGGTAITSG